jgi:cyanophycinase
MTNNKKGKIPVKGNLLISGAGRVEELRPRLIEAAGGPDARILMVPSNHGLKQSQDTQEGWPIVPEFKDGGAFEVDIEDPDFKRNWHWMVHWYQDFGVPNGAVLHTDHRDIADSDEFCDHIRTADAVFFTGGTPSKMMPTYLHTQAHGAFQELIDRGGAVAGWSAGASIQGDWSSDTEEKPFTEMFGFLPDVCIKTHFLKWNCQSDMARIVEKRHEVLGLGLDERAAIAVSGDEFEVFGTSYVAVYDYNKVLLPDGKYYLIGPGDRYSLTERKVVGEPKTYIKKVVERKWSEI